MGYWLHRIARSRRVRIATLGGIGLMTMGSCGGALLANYTVSGISPFYAGRLKPPRVEPARGVADWAAAEAFGSAEGPRTDAASADPWKPETGTKLE